MVNLPSYTLLRVRGIPVKVHVTYILFVVGLLCSFQFAQDTEWAARSLQTIFYLFVSILAHEFGHAICAVSIGHKVNQITVYPIGGLADIHMVNRDPVDKLKIALSGPFVNFLLFSVFVFFENLTLDSFCILNLLLGSLNLLPIASFDGGVALNAAMSKLSDEETATAWTLRISIGIVIAVAMLAVYMKSFLLGIAALFMLIYSLA